MYWLSLDVTSKSTYKLEQYSSWSLPTAFDLPKHRARPGQGLDLLALLFIRQRLYPKYWHAGLTFLRQTTEGRSGFLWLVTHTHPCPPYSGGFLSWLVPVLTYFDGFLSCFLHQLLNTTILIIQETAIARSQMCMPPFPAIGSMSQSAKGTQDRRCQTWKKRKDAKLLGGKQENSRDTGVLAYFDPLSRIWTPS